MDRCAMLKTAKRLTEVRADILEKHPFYGRLLMKLSFGFADCKTAYTDMQRIVFDPLFAEGLSDRELYFVMLHELMHCVLKHCVRGYEKNQRLYNIACDIVVNSLILEAMGEREIKVAGSPAMHLAPNGNEGREYSAEELYDMLLKAGEQGQGGYCGAVDDHGPWADITDTEALSEDMLEDMWDSYIEETAKKSGRGSGIPHRMQRVLDDIIESKRLDWVKVLHDFIQNDSFDYLFSPPDRRYSHTDVFLPSFSEDDVKGSAERLWFLVDTSGSVSAAALRTVLSEMKNAIDQVGSLSGDISFFDCLVSEPLPFDSTEEIDSLRPIGGGGTDFYEIFRALPRYYEQELPRGIIILTDGYAEFPPEDMAMGVPIIWIIVGSNVVPPYGQYVYLGDDAV